MASSSSDRRRWLDLQPLIDQPEPPRLEAHRGASFDAYRSRVGARCRKDGRPIAQHQRCTGCGALVGPEHVVTELRGGRCLSCR